jgi:hypothetical protein
MQTEPVRRPRKRRTVQTAIEMTEPLSVIEATPGAGESTDTLPAVIDTTGVALDDTGQPLPPPEPEPEPPRTDFYFPPLPRTPAGGGQASNPPKQRDAFNAPHQTWATTRVILLAGLHGVLLLLRGLLLLLRGLWRGLRLLAQGIAAASMSMGRGSRRSYQRWLAPVLGAVWRWITDDPYAPPRENTRQPILQGRVLGVYRYRLYQRILVGVFGSLPLAAISLYLLNDLISTFQAGVSDWLFWLQDIAGTLVGLFGCLIFLRLTSTRITLHSDGIEYKTWFRVVRSRWEEIAVLKVEYFRRNERWVVGTGRGAWAFLHRSVLGLPKGRQLAKLITLYARLNSTGTPYWLPAVGRFNENRAFGEIHLPQDKARRTRTISEA